MLFDLHMHTTRYSGCSRMSAEAVAKRAIEIGLDGIVITEHDAFWTDDEIESFRLSFPDLTILRGVEIGAAGGVDILVYGLTEMCGLERKMPPSQVVEIVHEHDGVAVWAHPLRRTLTPDPELFTIPFDGFESQSLNIDILERDLHLKTADQMGAFPIFNSDAHRESTLGVYATEFHDHIANEQELARALRHRRFDRVIHSHLLEPDWDIQQRNLEDRIRRAVKEEGITDPHSLRAKVGVLAIERIEQLLQS